jgi:hypothetical protein
MGLCWSLANPIAAPPDEATHVIRADALAHGQLIGRPAPKGAPRAITSVTVPQLIAGLQGDSACLDQGPAVPAACLQRITGSQQLVRQNILAGRYPPAYYALVGTASYASQGPKLVYLMRAVTALIVALLGGLALGLANSGPRRSIFGVVGPLVALTPMVLNLAGAVNPSGPEIAAAICMWVALGAIALTPVSRLPRYTVVFAAVAASTLVVVRGLSPVWLGLALLSLAVLVDRQQVAGLVSRFDARLAAGFVATVTAAALTWTFLVGALSQVSGIPVPAGTSEARLFRIAIDQLHLYYKEAVGNFGRLDTPVPLFCVVVVSIVVVALVALAAWRSSGRRRLSLALVIAASLAVPICAVLLTARRLGLVEQGRYFLPLWVGIPIVAAASIRTTVSRSQWEWWLRRALILAIAASYVVSFYGGLRRYTVGVHGPLSPFDQVAGGWKPPLPAWSLDGLFLVSASLVLVGLWGRSTRPAINEDSDRLIQDLRDPAESSVAR